MTEDRKPPSSSEAEREAREVAELASLAEALPAIAFDRERAARVLLRARRGPSPLRWVEPIATAAFAVSYMAWLLAKVLEALR